jgi:hypothetical protein
MCDGAELREEYRDGMLTDQQRATPLLFPFRSSGLFKFLNQHI